MKVTFGKYKGQESSELPLSYISWCFCFCKGFVSDFCAKEIESRGYELNKVLEEKDKLIRHGFMDEKGNWIKFTIKTDQRLWRI